MTVIGIIGTPIGTLLSCILKCYNYFSSCQQVVSLNIERRLNAIVFFERKSQAKLERTLMQKNICITHLFLISTK